MEWMKHEKYIALLKDLEERFPYWDRLEGKTLSISGVSGMLGSFLTDRKSTRLNSSHT